MALDQAISTPTPVPAPSFNTRGLTCTGTVTGGNNYSYNCYYIAPTDCSTITKYDLEHLRKPHFWALAAIIIYVAFNADAEGPYRFALRLMNQFRSSSTVQLRPHSRRTQIAALLLYLGMVWLVYIEATMVVITNWRMLHKVFVVWLPKLTPLRLYLLVLYPAWAMVAALCVAAVGVTVVAGISISSVTMKCIAEMIMIIVGMTELDDGQQSTLPTKENESIRQAPGDSGKSVSSGVT
ncbi:hypothetical protein F5B22DRAFT_271463 [Xylaria bambusicola]|uniref:uncharacterized protein n=1 Tax=Xylaria bambusicola TaxID=326684 RepID=UPI0020075D8C|nr:uncharacterized protein F5B22DRAFT_271463 [Xylaria bambusicola]KAI0513090.1 hypothetical protein F5B22DRAFT_271463 [Xylaria bambusicola]